jgi:PIN domain nuclease of toxin-antitoxin system
MWIIYLDTSALLKRYIQETGSEEVRKLLEEADEIATGVITRVETASAIARLVRSQAITAEEGKQAGTHSEKTGKSSPVCTSRLKASRGLPAWPGDMPCAAMTPFTSPAPSYGRNA